MIRLVIHGGAGALPRSEMTPEREADFHAALRDALRIGWGVLTRQGAALDAVAATVARMEDCPLFNAGRGSAFTSAGSIEMEASIMEGRSRKAGAAMLLRRVRNPVLLARAVMDETPHVALAGEAAERFALEHGLTLEPPSYFFTQFRYDAMLRLRGTARTALSEDDVVQMANPTEQDSSGTVGAVALDEEGHLAAATSSGGTTNKLPGRIGQACQIGSGCYAEDAGCAVSCTGHGEAFIRSAAASDVSFRVANLGWGVTRAASAVIHERVAGVGGRGGMIALDHLGQFVLPFNTQGMYRGWVDETGLASTAIYDAVVERRLEEP